MNTPSETVLTAQRELRRTLDAVEIGKPHKQDRLTVWPVTGGRKSAGYDLLDEAINAGTARVTEVGTGSVPELSFVNEGARPVLLADGEELLGAKQNRSLNLTILAPAKASITVPVSCMEAGRWHYDREHDSDSGKPEFFSSDHLMSASIRGTRMRDVSASLRTSRGRTRRSNQGTVWEDIGALAHSLDTSSATSALNDSFEHYSTNLDDFARSLRAPDGACGAVFAISGGAYGLDIFDAQSTFEALYPKLVRSWAIDAIAASRQKRSPHTEALNPRLVLDRLARRRCEAYPAVGLGTDIRLEQKYSRLGGAALVHEQAIVHLSAISSDQRGYAPHGHY